MAVSTRHRRPEELNAAEVMSGRVFAVGPEDDMRHALRTMRRERVRRLPVLDAENRLVGIVSIDDVALRAQPAGAGRAGADLTANELLETLGAICAHPLPAKSAAQAEPVHAG
jgi:CBS-domain-containing membrane protein